MQVKTQVDDLQNYLTDASNMSGGHADKMLIPESVDEVADILRDASEKRIAVTVSGARTGTVGGAIPFGGFVLSLERFNNIKNLDKAAKTVVVEPGVILSDLTKAVEADDLFYPPDPTEWSCQVGGTVATNASGARSFKYGDTRKYVQRLTVVLSSGDIADIRRSEFVSFNGSLNIVTRSGRRIEIPTPTFERPRVRKNVSGYFNAQPLDALDLFVGSEGTLGVIVEIELSLLAKPEGFFSGIVFFENDADLQGLVEQVKERSFASRQRVRDADLDATLLEYFDSRALSFIAERFPEVPAGMAGAVFFEQETTAANEDEMFEAWNNLLEKHGADLDRSWFTTNEQDRDKMRAFRHALPVAVNEHIARHKQAKIGTDMSVPDENFQAFLLYYKQTLDASGLDYVIFGHIGDCHLHANMLPKDAGEAERARHIYGRCVAQAIMLGGTVSAEHGIGKLKRKYLSAMMGERYLNEMAAVKLALDPGGILGRGSIFDENYLNT